LFDLGDGRVLHEEQLPIAWRTAFTLSPDTKTLAFLNGVVGDGSLQLRDFAKDGRTRSISRPEPAGFQPVEPLYQRLLFSPNGRYVAGIFADRSHSDLYLWDLQDNAASRHLARVELQSPEVSFRGDSKMLAY